MYMILNEVLMHIMVLLHHDVLIFRGMTQQSGTLIALEQHSQSSPLPMPYPSHRLIYKSLSYYPDFL